MVVAVVTRCRRLALVLSLVPLAALAAGGGLWWLIGRSLPRLDGTVPLPGLLAPVTVERDALGVPTIRGTTRLDVTRALGYLHAQDRFFQMDLLRRRSAGELAELLGAMALPLDRAARVHGFRGLARGALALLPPDHLALADAYAAGVNAGLASLRARPFEYSVLRVRPEPWRPEDIMLVSYALALDLQDVEAKGERLRAAVQNAYGDTVLDFLLPPGTEFDAALDGSTMPTPLIPGPAEIDLRRQPSPADAPLAHDGRSERDAARGSNAMALAGSRTASCAAMLANDMHLGLGVPNIWYRVSMAWGDDAPPPDRRTPGSPSGAAHRVTGVTVPGIPAVIAGSNGHVAWGCTNSGTDTADVVVVERDGLDPTRYSNGGDLTRIEERHETILVKGGDTVDATSQWTVWGPLVADDGPHGAFAVHWVFDDPAAMNFNILALETALDVAAALAAAPDIGIPAQNLLLADRAGAIGWTIAGRLPRRVGFDGRLPVSWADGRCRWDGYLPPADYPRVVSPRSGQLWSANNRHIGGSGYARLGDDGGYAPAARARQLRDDLAALSGAAVPGDLLAVQLDDRALFLERWQRLLIQVLTPDDVAGHPERIELRRLVAQWNGRASVDSVAYRLVRHWREMVADRVLGPIFAPCGDRLGGLDVRHLDHEEPLWRLVQARPANFLASDYGSWDELLLAAADDVLLDAKRQGRPLSRLTWGSRNTVHIRHPFSARLPTPLTRLLDMPAEPLPGDNDMPRVQRPSFGASERFVVSPGLESEGIFEMPGGQSGHPLSPFYRAGHEDWARGHSTPFLPGLTRHRLRLEP